MSTLLICIQVTSVMKKYPEWHKKTFLLTEEEVEDPYLVLDQFFDAYNLQDARNITNEILITAFESYSSDPDRLFRFSCFTNKLIEATRLILGHYRQEYLNAFKLDSNTP